ncbi:MAG: ectonucleotide pyrophosphatase/phosphodiesterase [Balneolaceae bacterium]|nr:ectonucleotide pyrophosphatase/phosphodiesterase [Balneolaceae bacterium]
MLVTAACTTSNNGAQTQPPKLLLVSIDGFRYDYLSKTETPNFDDFIQNGVTSEGLIPIVPSKTFPNHYSMVTGLYPENSGLVNNTMYDPEWDKWYRISDRQAVENGDWYQGEPIWNTAEKQGITTGTMFWIGSEADIQGMHPTYWKSYDGSMKDRARIDTVVSWFTKEQNPINSGTLYFELVDSYGHDYGTTSDSLVTAIEKSDRLLGYLKQRLQQAGTLGEHEYHRAV